ncbi:hypothetical protein [Ornithinimicrobium tianjinense]|nr:hypothetical protein [Ornithinimicrobium tianjinense]
MTLADDALVVRGGIARDASSVADRVEDAIESDGVAVLSVYAGQASPTEDQSDLLLRICRTADLRHGQVQTARAGDLRAAGFEIRHEVADGEQPNHYHVYFQVPMTELQAQVFIDCFDGPKPNPRPAEERKAR